MSIISDIRQQLFGNNPFGERIPLTSETSVGDIRTRPDLYDFLGETREAQATAIAEKLIPHTQYHAERTAIFEYIVDFLHSSTLEADVYAFIGKGVNLAKRPFLAPTGLMYLDKEKTQIGSALEHGQSGEFRFQEQYRWDTYFQNKFLLLIGAHDIARDQLLNFVDVYQAYGRIPNALASEFLSHSQPPFEALAAHDILHATGEQSNTAWYQAMMQTVERELFTEWWDHNLGRIHPRQDANYDKSTLFYNEEAPYLTRYTSIHFHPLMVGTQDGKDHQRLTAGYGEDYLSVQLHSLIWSVLNHLAEYYADDNERQALYQTAIEKLRTDINAFMWNEEAGLYRNYSIRDDEQIIYGDLSAQIFPLFVGLASLAQAQKIKNNLETYFESKIGLATTSETLRARGQLADPVAGWSDEDTQWELNIWPPLMMVAVEGLLHEKYSSEPGFADYAIKLQQKWVAWLEFQFEQDGTFHEKSPRDQVSDVSEGFYGNLPGFGWTIASYGTFLHRLAKIDGALDEVEQIKLAFHNNTKSS